MLRFTIIPSGPPPHDPLDLLIRFLANRSVLGALTVVADPDITMPELINASVLGALRVTTGDDFDILLPVLASTSVVDDVHELEVQESPPDGYIYLPEFANISLVNDTADLEVAESPPDGYIYTPTLANANTLGNLEVSTDEDLDYDPIAGAVIGGEGIA